LNIESKLDPVVYKRAVHVVGENSRTEQFAHLLSQGDYISAGRLMYQSHKSLKDDYEVSCPELDFMVEAFSKMDGVIGARMTGGGFGGSTVALVKKSKVNDVIEQIKKQYFEKFNIEATCLVTAASDGARIERL
jgi:galactokinase